LWISRFTKGQIPAIFMPTDVGYVHSTVSRDAKPQITQSVNWNNYHYTTTALTRKLRGGAQKSLAQPTSWCRRTVSIVSLKKGGGSVHVPNCKSFLVTEAERKHVRRRVRFQQHVDVSCHQNFFPARQDDEGNSRHSDRNIKGTCTIVCHRQKLGGPVYTWFFHLWCASSWTAQSSDHPGDYWSNSRANVGRPPDFG